MGFLASVYGLVSSWYNLLGVKAFLDFVDSPGIQETLFPAKLVFIIFTGFFFCAVVYFYVNSSYLQYQFLQDLAEFFSWHAYGAKEINQVWKRIMDKTKSGAEADYKLAIMEADDFLQQVLEEKGYDGETFEELVGKAGKGMISNEEEILQAHQIRNTAVYNASYQLAAEEAKRILALYETAIKNIAVG